MAGREAHPWQWVYRMSSLSNHDCMPNVAEYNDFDSTMEENAVVDFRALHTKHS